MTIRLIALLALCAATTASAQVAGGGRTGGPPASISTTGGPPPGLPVGTGTGAISGLVVDAATGAPLADAVVYLALDGRPVGSQPRQFTDEQGRFVFVNLPDGRAFTVSASHPDYLAGGYSRFPAAGAGMGAIVLDAGEWMRDARVALVKPGAISGRVTDERGEPVVGVYVRALTLVRLQARDEFARGPMALTDDRGVYRLPGLPGGRYLVQVPSLNWTLADDTRMVPRAGVPDTAIDAAPGTLFAIGRTPLPPPAADGVPRVYPMTLYPNAARPADASVIELSPGEDRTGIDVRLAPVTTGRIAGRVEGPPDAMKSLHLRLLPQGFEGLGLGAEIASAQVMPDGTFLFARVPPGAYVIDAPLQLVELTTVPSSLSTFENQFRMPPPPGTPGWGWSSGELDAAPAGTQWSVTTLRGQVPAFAARQPVVVSGTGETTVTITMRPLGTLSGRVVTERAPNAPPPTASMPRVVIEPANASPDLGLARISYGPDGPTETFTAEGLRAGQYVVRINTYGGWVIKSIAWRGRDYTDQPFDLAATTDVADVVVTVTNGVPVTTGIVRNERGQPVPDAAVLAFPADRTLWSNYGFSPTRLKMTRASSRGEYRHDGLPAGSYLIVAMPAHAANGWSDPAFLERAAALATPVALSWGASRTQDLVLRDVR